jgi:ubiquinone/menaquinone biosynthesis C-methylase UbiE
MNYFNPKNTAERYAKGRPYFHADTIEKIGKALQLKTNIDKALDVACGTGLSSKALLNIANQVYGTDTSEEMLKYARLNQGINFQKATAENLPFQELEFDLITVCSGVHWFQIDSFLKESHRILKENAWLVLYDNFFISEMQEVPSFKNWFPNVYLKKYPSPPRNNTYDWSNKTLKPKGFSLEKEESFKNQVSFSKEELILYFTTQSNITACVASKQATYSQIENWLDKELNAFFPNEETRRTLNYGNWVKYLQKL